jgi:precorrin-8X/cobalt-precorrin-8 methylmutase
METIVIVGNSQTRMIDGRMVTPRGYTALAPAFDQGRERKIVKRPNPGSDIMAESFATIERELGDHSLPPWAFAVVRRMIHASADFDFAKTLRYSADFPDAIQTAFHDRELTGSSADSTGKSAGPTLVKDRLTVVTDTEMVLTGIRSAFYDHPAITLTCLINDGTTMELAQSCGLTRSAAGIRLAAERFERPILVIGNAPTALIEALRLVSDGWRPRAIIGMPVGFVDVEEAKLRLFNQSIVPHLTCVGRKGGSAVAAAAMNALVEWFKSPTTSGVS